MKYENKTDERVKMPGETKRGSKNSGAMRREYGTTDMIEKVIELKGDDIKRDWDKTKDFVEECCKSLGCFWGLVPLVEFIQSEEFFNRVVEIIIKVSTENDPKIKRIINKINSGKKDITKEESEKLNGFIEEVLKNGKSKEEQDRITSEYRIRREVLNKIRETQEETRNKFFKSYDAYINEILKQAFEIKIFDSEKYLEDVINTNNELLELIDTKTNKFLYENEIRSIICEAFDIKENGGNIDINQLAEMIKQTGQLYGVDSRKDIQGLIDFERM